MSKYDTHDDTWTFQDANVRPSSAVGRAAPELPAVLVGELIGLLDADRAPILQFDGQPSGVAVIGRSVVDLQPEHIGCPVVLAFDGGRSGLPIVLGVLRTPQHATQRLPNTVEVLIDDGRTVVSAAEQLVLRCGAASITLTRAGKVLIQGAYVLNAATGVNRVLGGTVQIN